MDWKQGDSYTTNLALSYIHILRIALRIMYIMNRILPRVYYESAIHST